VNKFDLIIRNGAVIDGSGQPPYTADVAVRDSRIAEIGNVTAGGREEIDGTGRIITPGFVDIHTHYDGHATWSRQLNPSSAHGVTTVVMGNCGVGFAPCRLLDRERLIKLMEGVEDIPHVVMAEGIPWNWETFPEYLNALDRRSYDVDIATQLPHAAVRVYVMGERAAARECATSDEIGRMEIIAEEAIRAGALGFSTSRTLAHKAVDGSLTPSYAAAKEELVRIAKSVSAAGAGVLQFISDFDDEDAEFAIVREMVGESSRPLSLSLMQFPHAPERWSSILRKIDGANRDGLTVRAQVCGRPVGGLLGLELSFNPFTHCPGYQQIAHLPFERRLAALREPALKNRILREFPHITADAISARLVDLESLFLMDDPPNYEPSPAESIAAQSSKHGLSPKEYAYQLLIADGGKNIIYMPGANYVDCKMDAVEAMLHNGNTILGLGDGGAHCSLVCDASLPTYMLTRWARGPERGGFSIAEVVKKLTHDTAAAVGLGDRGLLRTGYRADLNVIDLDRLQLHRPEMVYDLPKGGGRLHQRATGYEATIVRGRITYRGGQHTGELPGRLIRGQQSPPASSHEHH
jgi:N-acyl-D-aspartate/D-glutamate deacylase